MIGRFHEISIATPDIRESVEFYETLGFVHTPTNDTWGHPYGVLTDGRIFIGLHQRRLTSPALTFVRPEVAAHVAALGARGIALTEQRLGADEFNRVSFVDPGGQTVTLLEARTYSPPGEDAQTAALCGTFAGISLPERDFDAAVQFWTRLGFVAAADKDRPWPSERLTTPALAIEFHRPRTFDAPLLIFTAPDMAARLTALRARKIAITDELPRGLQPAANALIAAPEGTGLLLLDAS